MADDRKSRERLKKDSDWVQRLNHVVEKSSRVSVFRRPPDDEARVAHPRTPMTVQHHPLQPQVESWASLGEIRPRARNLRERGAPLVSFHRDGPVAKAFDLLRTRLVHTLRQHGWSRIAITAPKRGAGATFTAVNLALSLARVPGTRTILMDMNQRHPGVADALDVGGTGEMRHFLTGQTSMSDHLVRLGDTLALGLNATPYRDSADLLHDRRTALALERMQDALAPDVVLYDMPAILDYDDLGAFLPQIDGVLLVSDGTATTARQIAECERVLDGQTQLLGVILNRARGSITDRLRR
ncbi:CpsD/CapB family tyrosine-protein kinase [Oceaniglobus indicus]|uniref:CpsD/CapB family tyrosine-protein kinase n=1 Tax=Oceaniglobus indicus TaxID=2047749 RepID=UPI0011AB319E|nr:CpsD/CapB family tyrosine-protein kinase [Oceaniglobus indicus]